MKTTIELPDDLFREAKATAARRGAHLKDFMRDAVAEKLARETSSPPAGDKRWPVPPPDVPLEELQRIHARIEEDSERIDDEEL